MTYREPCMCGALDCVACRGKDAKFVGMCDECEHESVCKDAPSKNCRRGQEMEDEWADYKLDLMRGL